MKLPVFLSTLLKRIAAIGTDRIEDHRLRWRISLSNIMAVIVWASSMLVSIPAFFVSAGWGLFFTLVPVAHLGVLLLNRRGWHVAARFFFSFLPLLLCATGSGLFLHEITIAKFAFVTVILCPIFFFGSDEPGKMLIGTAGIILEFWALDWIAAAMPKVSAVTISPGMAWLISSLTITSSTALFVLSFLYLQRRERAHERTMQQTMRELDEANRIKDWFFGIISHDLKNPLLGIDMAARRLVETLPADTIETTCRTTGEVISRAARSGMLLVERLCSWQQSKFGSIDQRPLDISAIFRDISCFFDTQLKEKGLTLHIWTSNTAQVQADHESLACILRNLLTNAIKFSTPGGEIILGATCTRGYSMFTIADHGIGMPPHVRDSLFTVGKKFLQRGTAGETGSGLGLMIVQELVKRHGGRIKILSRPGKGTAAIFTLAHPRS